MTEKLTWNEFFEKYKPKHGDYFCDDNMKLWSNADGSYEVDE